MTRLAGPPKRDNPCARRPVVLTELMIRSVCPGVTYRLLVVISPVTALVIVLVVSVWSLTDDEELVCINGGRIVVEEPLDVHVLECYETISSLPDQLEKLTTGPSTAPLSPSLTDFIAIGAETTLENIRLLPYILPDFPLGPPPDPGVDVWTLLNGPLASPLGVAGCSEDEEEASVRGIIRAEEAEEEFDWDWE